MSMLRIAWNGIGREQRMKILPIVAAYMSGASKMQPQADSSSSFSCSKKV